MPQRRRRRTRRAPRSVEAQIGGNILRRAFATVRDAASRAARDAHKYVKDNRVISRNIPRYLPGRIGNTLGYAASQAGYGTRRRTGRRRVMRA